MGGAASLDSLFEDHRRDPNPHPRLKAQIQQMIAVAVGGAIALGSGLPAALTYGGAGSAGVAATAARSDHVHPLPSYPNATISSYGVVVLAGPGDTTAGSVVQGNDPRLVANPLTGVLTANRIPYWNGSALADDAVNSWDPSGQMVVLDKGTGALPAIVSSASVMRLSQADGTSQVAIEVDTFSASAGGGFGIYARNAGGTRASPAATPGGSVFWSIGGLGHDGTAYSNQRGIFRCLADTLWSGVNTGTFFEFLGTPGGSTTRATWGTIRNAQLQWGDGTVSLPGYSFQSDVDTGWRRVGANNVRAVMGGVDIVDYSSSGVSLLAGNLTLSARNIITDTTTGMIVATATTQKLGFWAATPIVQPVPLGLTALSVAGVGATLRVDSTASGGVGASAYSFTDIVRILKNLGLLAA